MTYKDIISLLKLEPHPAEGGYFRETYRSVENIDSEKLPDRYSGSRAFGTCIYYLLTPDTFSAFHRLNSDEIFHFYTGDPVEINLLYPDGSGKTLIIGPFLGKGMFPQAIVPKGIWQGSRLMKGGKYALLGTTVAPGFDYSDYEQGERYSLLKMFPSFSEMIFKLTI